MKRNEITRTLKVRDAHVHSKQIIEQLRKLIKLVTDQRAIPSNFSTFECRDADNVITYSPMHANVEYEINYETFDCYTSSWNRNYHHGGAEDYKRSEMTVAELEKVYEEFMIKARDVAQKLIMQELVENRINSILQS